MSEGLEPCPFCGEHLVANDHPRRRRDDHEIMIYTHPQGNCHLAGYQIDHAERELWNRRALRPAPEGVWVPEEPTQHMWDAGKEMLAAMLEAGTSIDVELVYKTMVLASKRASE